MGVNHSRDRKLQRLVDLKFAQTELQVFEDFRKTVLEEQEQIRMRNVTAIESNEFIDRLLFAGFQAENVHALSLYPVAMVAWASGSVSEAEAKAAEQIVFDSEVSGSAEAVELFRNWMQSKPHALMWDLWEDFTLSRASALGREHNTELGKTILNVAQRVALASGGFLGFNAVCAEEQAVLDRVQSVYCF